MSMNRVSDAELNSQTRPLNVNRYATKKTIAQGMLDVALLTANASQLRYVLQTGGVHEFYTLMVVLISLSIALQVIIGVLSLSLNLLRDCRLDKGEYAKSANTINLFSLIVVYFVTAINVLIATFDVLVGILLIALGSLDIDSAKHRLAADILNDLSVMFIFLISILNIVIAGFGIHDASGSMKLNAMDIVK